MKRKGKALLMLLAGVSVVLLAMALLPGVRAQAGGPVYTSDGGLQQPQGFRHWKFIGATVTPNGLNGGKAGFPEFHHVYVEQANFDVYRKNGVFPEGTVIVKELTLTRNSTYPDGSADEASGRGFFEGEPNGLDVSVKDSKRFAATNNWGFFNFGHHAQPYAESSKKSSKAECASCHAAGASKTDMTWVQFYPNLRSTN